jgi:cytochrome c6
MLRVLAFLLIFTTTAAAQAKKTDAASGDSEKVYKAKCAGCHAADGSGNTAFGKKTHLHDLRSDEVQKASDAELAETIAKGKGKMPGYAKQLKEDEIKGLVGYMRSLAKKK